MADSEFTKPKVGFGFGDEAEKAASPADGVETKKKKVDSSGEDGPKHRRGKLRHRQSKRSKSNAAKVSRDPVDAATAMSHVKRFEGTKFDQSVDVVFHLGVDTRQADQQVRGAVSLPKGIGKAKRVIAFCREDQVAAAKAAGAVEAGGVAGCSGRRA